MTMTIKERINRFCEKYPEPKQPKFDLYWTNKGGKHVATLGCDKENVVKYNKTITRTTGKPLYVIHYLYDAETELMECSYAVIKCTVPKSSENRKWTYAERYFIPKEEKQIYDIYGGSNQYVIHDSCGVRNTNNKKYFLQYQSRLNKISNMFGTAFMALTNNHPDLPPRFENFATHSWIMPEWIIHNPTNHVNSKTQQIVDDFIPWVNNIAIPKIESGIKRGQKKFCFSSENEFFTCEADDRDSGGYLYCGFYSTEKYDEMIKESII